MKKLLILAIFLIFMYACVPTSKQSLLGYKTGTSGVEMNFANNAPPTTVFENNQFEIALFLENKGAYDVTGNRGIVRVITDENLQLADQNYAFFSLRGRSDQTPEGEQKIIPFRVFAKPLSTQTEIITSPISALTCYPYLADASADVCIDTDVYGQIEARRKPCTAKSVSLSGQGGPVAVTIVDAQMVPVGGDSVRPQFTITVSNRGKGEVIHPDIIERLCRGTASAEEKAQGAKVRIDSVQLGGNPIECQAYELELKDGQATFTCAATSIPRSQPTFLSSFAMSISYGYMQTIGKTIEIKKSPFEGQ